MASTGRFAFALAFSVAVAIAATVAAVSLTSGRDALQLDELLQHEPMPQGAPGSLEEHLVWTFEVFGGQRRWTETELNARFTRGFNEGFDAATLNAGLDQLFVDFGPVRFHRLTEHGTRTIRALAVAENGTPITIWLSVNSSGQVESLTLDEVPWPPRVPPWQATLVVVASWSFVAAAVVASRSRDTTQAWPLLAAALIVASTVLQLSDSRAAYTAGRLVPVMALPIVVWVLAKALSPRANRALVGAAAVAAAPAVLAPLTRAADLIGHPALHGSITDSETLYRSLWAASFAAGGLTMGVVGARALALLPRSDLGTRSHRLSAALVATTWAVASIASSIDYAIGDGTWAHGPMAAMLSASAVLVPVVAVVGVVAARWDRPGIERLVIDLEADNAGLDRAVAAALEDPTAEILISSDGKHLTTRTGAVIDPEGLASGRATTEIRSGERLVGSIVHDSTLRHHPARLEAVAAAAGMALEVDRLNQQVLAQLDEVNASRARIVQASDTARRQVERDLHDGAQQRLVALGLQLQRARRLADSGRTDDLVCLLDGAADEIRDTIDDIRAVSRGGAPALLAERGLAAAVDALAERASVPVTIDIATGDLPAQVESTAYFVIAEALTNIAKHSDATNASVTVTSADGEAAIRIVDDGQGGAAAAPGSGLEGLDDRVATAGGTLRLQSAATGTTLEVTLPCA